MWWAWLIFCDYGFHSVCPLMETAKGLIEAPWWERLTVGQSGSFSYGPAGTLPQPYGIPSGLFSAEEIPLLRDGPPPQLPGHSHLRTGPCGGTRTPAGTSLPRPPSSSTRWCSCGFVVTHHSPVSPSAPSYVLQGLTGFHPKSFPKENSCLQHFYLRICSWWTQLVTPSQAHGVIFLPKLSRKRGRTGKVGPGLTSCRPYCGLCGGTRAWAIFWWLHPLTLF